LHNIRIIVILIYNTFKMKKSNKKTPKSHLPKYERGGPGRAGADTTRTMYSGSEDAVMGNSTYQAPAQSGNSTDSVYNQGRQSKISAGQYAQYGQAAMGLGTQLAANQSLTGEDKQYANNKAISGTVDSTLAAATPWYGYAKAGSDMGRSMVQRDETGAPVGKMNKQLDAVMKPQHQMAIDDATKGNYGLAAAEMFMPGIGYESRSNSLGMGEGINKMFNSNNSSTYQYANGGMNMQPNAEVEKQENTLNPDGSTTQFDGPSHEQGGIPTNLEKGTMIFSDKLKHNGKTFAQLNKTNMTHKEDKILDDKKASAISKLTANLMKQAKNKSSEELFEKQESLKQERVEKYIKRMGGVQKYPLGGTSGQTLNNNSIVTPSIGQDPRYYTYQGNPVMKPGLRALSKDSGVTTDIGMNNYNNLLNTRSQVQNSKVNVGKQLPKFEYINDPSKGDYNTQFENYKKVNVGYFRNGGQLPKYDEGGFGYNPKNNVDKMKMQQAFLNNQQLQGSNPLVTTPVQKVNTDYTDYNQQAYDNELASMNASGGRETNPNSKNFDWKGLATQGAYFAANNAGNIFDLARADKTETRKYDRMTATLLDPTAALRDAEAQTRRAEYNVRGASGGNAGTYLSNRVALNTQNIENKDRIRQQYANANAGILNETSKINTGIANEEILANAKIRANARNIKQSAIASMGSNTANQMNDIRNTNMDQKRLDNLVKMYPSLSKDPEMLKYLMSFK
jgi:hypothetical protein